MNTLENTLDHLRALADPDALPGMARFGIQTDKRLGITVPKLRALAREIGANHDLALELWGTAVPDARILASLLADPARTTPQLMDAWTADFNSWDICDACCNNLYIKTPHAWDKVSLWAAGEAEFVCRAGFVLIACLAMHDKAASDTRFIETFPLIKAHASDPRNFVRKAVNWALRAIGKRNPALNQASVTFAGELLALDDKTARWIAGDALRELESEKIQSRLRGRAAASSG
jgi:3-methyladenine DNA glycosylase AlkD